MLMHITSELNIQEFQSPQTANSTLNAAKEIASKFLSETTGEGIAKTGPRGDVLAENHQLESDKVNAEQISEINSLCDYSKSIASSPSNFTRSEIRRPGNRSLKLRKKCVSRTLDTIVASSISESRAYFTDESFCIDTSSTSERGKAKARLRMFALFTANDDRADDTAEWCSRNICQELKSALLARRNQAVCLGISDWCCLESNKYICSSLEDACISLDSNLCENLRKVKPTKKGGCSGVIIIISNFTIFTANVGSCGAILHKHSSVNVSARSSLILSHNYSVGALLEIENSNSCDVNQDRLSKILALQQREQERISLAGGYFDKERSCVCVQMKSGVVMSSPLTRAFGESGLKSSNPLQYASIVTPLPEISYIQRSKVDDWFLLLGSGNLWEGITKIEAVKSAVLAFQSGAVNEPVQQKVTRACNNVLDQYKRRSRHQHVVSDISLALICCKDFNNVKNESNHELDDVTWFTSESQNINALKYEKSQERRSNAMNKACIKEDDSPVLQEKLPDARNKKSLPTSYSTASLFDEFDEATCSSSREKKAKLVFELSRGRIDSTVLFSLLILCVSVAFAVVSGDLNDYSSINYTAQVFILLLGGTCLTALYSFGFCNF